jgi:hypothetical protein
MEGTIKGETYTYLGKVAHCLDCDSEIYVEEINDFNLKALYDKYREEHGIVSLDTILSSSEKAIFESVVKHVCSYNTMDIITKNVELTMVLLI